MRLRSIKFNLKTRYITIQAKKFGNTPGFDYKKKLEQLNVLVSWILNKYYLNLEFHPNSLFDDLMSSGYQTIIPFDPVSSVIARSIRTRKAEKIKILSNRIPNILN